MQNKTLKNKISIALVGWGFLLFVSAAFGQLEQTPTATDGLMSRLLEIKYGSESYISTALKKESNKDTYKDTSKDTAIALYNTLRWKIDALVYTLSSDMITANSPRKLKLLNDWCLDQATPIKNGYAKNESIKIYSQMLYEIDCIPKALLIIMYHKEHSTSPPMYFIY
jgi:hypothetical protein